MASQVVRDFYAQRKADDIARIQTMIQSGTKASNNLAIGRRMMNPTYKGMVPNASGVGQRPFFINKDEVNFPLEDKVAMRGGVLSTPAGQSYGKKILARRAMDIRNQEALQEGLPPAPSPLVELTEVESRTIELNQLMDRLASLVNEGGADISQIIPDYRNLVRLIVSLSATFSQSDLAFIDNWAANIALKLDNLATLNREGNALGQPRVAQRQNNSLQVLADLTGKISLFIERVAEVVDTDPQTKRAVIRIAARQIFSTIGRLDESRVEAIAQEAAGPAEPEPAIAQEAAVPAEPEPAVGQRRRIIVPSPPAPVRRAATEEDQQLARVDARRAAEEGDEAAEERAVAQRRGPVDMASYKTSQGTELTERDKAFVDRIKDIMSTGEDYKLRDLRNIAEARGIDTRGTSKAVLKGRVLRDAGFTAWYKKE
jgi:hypothetical protein